MAYDKPRGKHARIDISEPKPEEALDEEAIPYNASESDEALAAPADAPEPDEEAPVVVDGIVGDEPSSYVRTNLSTEQEASDEGEGDSPLPDNDAASNAGEDEVAQDCSQPTVAFEPVEADPAAATMAFEPIVVEPAAQTVAFDPVAVAEDPQDTPDEDPAEDETAQATDETVDDPASDAAETDEETFGETETDQTEGDIEPEHDEEEGPSEDLDPEDEFTFEPIDTAAFAAMPRIDTSGFDIDGDTLRELNENGALPANYVTEFDLSKKRSRKAGKIVGITFGAIAAVVAIVYVAGALVFSGRYLPNTTIGDLDISMKTTDEVASMVKNVGANYTLDVVGDGFAYRTDAKGVGLDVDGYAIAQAIHDDLNSWTWPALIMQPSHEESDCFEAKFTAASFAEDVKAAVATFNETATPPTNATIVYDENSDSFKVKPEEVGTQLDPEAVIATMADAIGSLSPKAVLDEKQLLQPTVLSTDEKLNQSAEMATGMTKAKLTLNLNGVQVGSIGSDELSQFVRLDEKLDVTLDDAAMDAWINEQANGYNTVGSTRTFTRADGKVITVGGGSYGWEVDVEALKAAITENVRAGGETTIEIPCTKTAALYEGKGMRDWGNRYIDVDLAEQYVRFYGDDGSIIWESPCISGKPDGVHDTSVGVFTINTKASPSKLIGYENGVKIYESQVTYWMPFDGNAIGLHDADWQPGFGGTMYADGYGSHGCVNLPPYAAAELYNICYSGDVVVSHW